MICENPKAQFDIFPKSIRVPLLSAVPYEFNSQALFFVLLFLIGVCEWLVCVCVWCGEGAREVLTTGHNIESIGVRGLRMVQVQWRPTRPQRAIASSKKEHAERWRAAFLFSPRRSQVILRHAINSPCISISTHTVLAADHKTFVLSMPYS